MFVIVLPIDFEINPLIKLRSQYTDILNQTLIFTSELTIF